MTKSTFLKNAFGVFFAFTLMACGDKPKQANDNSSAQNTAQTVEQTVPTKSVDVDAPDFTLTDINGKPLTLSSLRGKYVVLDFWGSWCGWCIKGIPQMKEYYKKYAGKFEILGIDCNDSEEAWRAAVDEYELPWLHVYCSDEKVLKDYDIQGFPTKVIITPEGKIEQMIIGEDPEFYAILDKLLG